MDQKSVEQNKEQAEKEQASKLQNLLKSSKQESSDAQMEELDKQLKLTKLRSIHPVLPKSGESCIVHYQGKQIELPVLKGKDGLQFIDIQALYAKAGVFCYDPGYAFTGSCMSSITMAREDGEIFYRGYAVSELVEKSNYVEVCYILLYGDRPNPDELAQFEARIKSEMLVHQKIHDMYKGFHPDANPMAQLGSVVAGLSSFMGSENVRDSAYREDTAIKLIARMPVLAAIAFRNSVGLPIVGPDKNLDFVHNFLHMMFQDPMDSHCQIPEIFVTLMMKMMILYADMGQGPSTTAVRIAGSSLANPYATISAGIASLWGHHHGGAAEECLRMFKQIGSVDRVADYVNGCKKKENRLWGFGHRVLKGYDCRARAIKAMIFQFRDKIGLTEELNNLFEIALEIERLAVADEYFTSRGVYPNVDYYCGILLTAMHIPSNMISVIIAISRSTGWICHWREMMGDQVIKIYRPRQIYVGQFEREFVDIELRNDAPGFTFTSTKDIQ